MNSFRTLVRKLFKFSLHKRKLNVETIWDFQGFKSSKKNSFHGNNLRKYGRLFGNEFLCLFFWLGMIWNITFFELLKIQIRQHNTMVGFFHPLIVILIDLAHYDKTVKRCHVNLTLSFYVCSYFLTFIKSMELHKMSGLDHPAWILKYGCSNNSSSDFSKIF